MKSSLTQRKQCVHVNGEYSSFFEIKFGVPQGSVLGPVLFLMYIKDIVAAIPGNEYILYADDTTIVTGLC